MIALYPGAYKPPHRGHYNVVKSLLDGTYNGSLYNKDNYKETGASLLGGSNGEKPDIDKVIVFVGAGERNGISKDESMYIWNIYAKYLGNVEIRDGGSNPMFAAKDYAQANPEQKFASVTGIRGEKDFVDLRRVTTYKNAPNVKGLALAAKPGSTIRATDFRNNILSGNLDTVLDFFPEDLSREEILNILTGLKDKIVAEILTSNLGGIIDEYFAPEEPAIKNTPVESKKKNDTDNLYRYLSRLIPNNASIKYNKNTITVGYPELNESTEKKLELKDYISSLLEYMLERKMNILPLPEVKIKKDPIEASNFFGRTAYYSPALKEIVLFVEGRHDKDIVRSFSHEMIHHMQNIEGRLGRIDTSNTNEDGYLMEIEKEAYLLGNITFRNWEDSLKNLDGDKSIKENKTITEGRYDAITTYLTNKSIEGVKNALAKKINHYKEGHFGDVKTESAQIAMKKVVEDSYPIVILSLPDDIDKEFQKESDVEFDYDLKAIFVKGCDSIMRNGGASKGGFDSTDSWIQPKVELEFVLDPYNFPRDFEELSAQITDVLRHEIEHLTQAGGNERSKSFGKDAQFKGIFGTSKEKEFREKIRSGDIKNGYKYLTIPSEIDANIQGLYLSAKKAKRPFKDVVDQYLYDFTEQYDENGDPYLTKQDVEDVKRVWSLRLKSLGIKEKL